MIKQFFFFMKHHLENSSYDFYSQFFYDPVPEVADFQHPGWSSPWPSVFDKINVK